MGFEVLSLDKIGSFLNRFPALKMSGDNIRTSMTMILEVALLVGGINAGSQIWGGTGIFMVVGLYILNEVLGRPVIKMAAAPLAAIVVGVLANIAAACFLCKGLPRGRKPLTLPEGGQMMGTQLSLKGIVMFLDRLLTSNPALAELAFEWHRQGIIEPDTYVLDLDAIAQNARAMQNEACECGITLYYMLKQIGRNPLIAQAVEGAGFRGAVCVDWREALVMARAGMHLGNVGHLVQTPVSVLPEIVAAKPDIMTVYSIEKARQIGEAAAKLELQQPIMLRVLGPNDTLYSGQYGGFRIEELRPVIEELEKILKNAEVVVEDEVDLDRINIGCKVKILDLEYDEELDYKIVGSTEANSLKGKISNESPVGKALMGARIGDVVEVETQDGVIRYKVLEIERSN